MGWVGKWRLQGFCLSRRAAADFGEKHGIITEMRGSIEGASMIRSQGFISVLACAQDLPSHFPCSGGRTLGCHGRLGNESRLCPS